MPGWDFFRSGFVDGKQKICKWDSASMEEEDQGRRLKWSTYEQGGKILILRRSKSFPRLMRVSAVPLLFFLGSPVNRIVTYFNDEIKFE